MIPLKEEETCCGFGGAFTVTFPEVSRSMMENKVKHILASGADTVVMCEPGCLMNIAGGLHKAGSTFALCTSLICWPDTELIMLPGD